MRPMRQLNALKAVGLRWAIPLFFHACIQKRRGPLSRRTGMCILQMLSEMVIEEEFLRSIAFLEFMGTFQMFKPKFQITLRNSRKSFAAVSCSESLTEISSNFVRR